MRPKDIKPALDLPGISPQANLPTISPEVEKNSKYQKKLDQFKKKYWISSEIILSASLSLPPEKPERRAAEEGEEKAERKTKARYISDRCR